LMIGQNIMMQSKVLEMNFGPASNSYVSFICELKAKLDNPNFAF